MYSIDVGSAFVSLLDSKVEGPVNIASGKPVTIGDIVRTIASKIGRPDLVRLGAIPAPADEPPVILADTGRLNGDVGWKPKYSLDEGLDMTIEWWKQRMEKL
jgi:UDP-glucose 4-epimerase